LENYENIMIFENPIYPELFEDYQISKKNKSKLEEVKKEIEKEKEKLRKYI